jgi:hypothetical protein
LPFVIPAELLKVKKQGKKSSSKSYPEIIKNNMKEEGVKGLYRGFWISFWRYVPQYGLYFYIYAKLQQIFESFDENEERKRSRIILEKTMAGGLAGMIGWFTAYPFDALKSYIQYHPEHSSMIKTAKFLYNKHGMGYFYKGVGVTMLRAFPVNALTFVVYDSINKAMKERGF